MLRMRSKLFITVFFIVILGCAKKLDEAKYYAQKSNIYFEKAVEAYEKSLLTAEDPDKSHLGLGMLYYTRGDFEKAIKEFKETPQDQAKKYMGISYYKLGDFTDALEVFRQLESWDDAEYLFYYGLASERLNLYDQAMNLYNKIKDTEYTAKALERINIITKFRQKEKFADLDVETKNLILKSPDINAFPQAGALILYCDESFEINPNNTLVSTGHFLIKILNERGKKEFSEIEIDYDSTFEKVELEFARVIKPDGEIVQVGKKHIRDVSKYLNFPLYSNVRVHIISLPEISENAIIEYKIRVYKNRLVNKKDFFLAYPLQTIEPILFCRFSVSLPKERRLNIKLLNEEYNDFNALLSPRVLEDREKKVYSWEFKHIPQIIPEPNMPPLAKINPIIMLSTFNSWEEVYHWWWELTGDKIRVNPAIKEKVVELTRGLKGPEEKARAIYNFVAKDIRYVAVEYGQAGYEPHSAEEIFLNKYGDCKDKAVLLVSMLREAGLNAFPVLISTKDYYNLNPDFPSAQFNHAITAVELEAKLVFLDSTAETCSFQDLPSGDQARGVLIFKDRSYKIDTTPLYPAKNNLVKDKLKIEVNKNGAINAQKSISTSGYYDQAQRYWLLYTPPKLIEETLKEKIQETSVGAQLDNVDIDNLGDLNKPVELSYTFKGSDYFIVAADIYILPQLSQIDTSYVAKESRGYPIDFEVLDTFEKLIEIKIPENLKIRFLPPSFEKDSPWMRYKVEYSQDGNKLYFHETKELKQVSISTKDYPEFKKFMEEIARIIKQRVVLEKVK